MHVKFHDRNCNGFTTVKITAFPLAEINTKKLEYVNSPGTKGISFMSFSSEY